MTSTHPGVCAVEHCAHHTLIGPLPLTILAVLAIILCGVQLCIRKVTK